MKYASGKWKENEDESKRFWQEQKDGSFCIVCIFVHSGNRMHYVRVLVVTICEIFHSCWVVVHSKARRCLREKSLTAASIAGRPSPKKFSIPTANITSLGYSTKQNLPYTNAISIALDTDLFRRWTNTLMCLVIELGNILSAVFATWRSTLNKVLN